jgi:thioesterase domain-containing protein
MDAWYTPALQRMRDRAYVGLKTYRPRFYPGSIKFVRAATVTEFPDDAKAVWKPLVREIEVVTAPGDHLEIINAHFEAVGAALSRYLSETSKYQERQVRANHPASK